MKKYLFILLLPVLALADPPISTNAQFKVAVRTVIGIEDNILVPDTSLQANMKEAYVHTSVDVGGIQAQYRIITVAKQAFYAIPDTISEVLTVGFIGSDGGVYAVAPLPSELYEQTGGPTTLTDESKYSVPLAFNWWSDTIQLMPQPFKSDDSVVLKCHVEYTIDTTTVTAAATILFKAPYTEAAKFYCAYLTMLDLRMYDEANIFLEYYENLRRKLRARYQNQFAMPVKDAP